MGLFGPSWSWEEIQRKDAIMNDLRKENDRVLDRQRRENDRMIREISRNNRYESPSFSSLDYAEMAEDTRKRNAARNQLGRAYLISKRYLKYLREFIGDMFWTFVGIMIFIGLIALFHEVMIIAIILSVVTLAITIQEINKFISPFKDAKAIRKTECYKKILEKVKDMNSNEIKEIVVDSSAVRITAENGKKSEFYYSAYKFPALPQEKQSIFMGCLLIDLGNNKDFNLTTPERGGNFTAENKKIIAKIEKENKQKEKEKKKKKAQDIKAGKTW